MLENELTNTITGVARLTVEQLQRYLEEFSLLSTPICTIFLCNKHLNDLKEDYLRREDMAAYNIVNSLAINPESAVQFCRVKVCYHPLLPHSLITSGYIAGIRNSNIESQSVDIEIEL